MSKKLNFGVGDLVVHVPVGLELGIILELREHRKGQHAKVLWNGEERPLWNFSYNLRPVQPDELRAAGVDESGRE